MVLIDAVRSNGPLSRSRSSALSFCAINSFWPYGGVCTYLVGAAAARPDKKSKTTTMTSSFVLQRSS
jgi:hypothetical protein